MPQQQEMLPQKRRRKPVYHDDEIYDLDEQQETKFNKQGNLRGMIKNKPRSDKIDKQDGMKD